MTSGKQHRADMKRRRKAKADKRSQIRIADPRWMEAVPDAAMAPCNPERLQHWEAHSPPAFVLRGCYVDTAFDCVDCGTREVWRATQQKWWYEVARGSVDSHAIRCRACRRKDRARAADARRIHLDGVAAKRRKRDGEHPGH